jgi:hypothetical protein
LPSQAPIPKTAASAPAPASGPGRAEGALVGQALDHFKVDGFLAAGGMGEVYRGTDTSLNRPVAIKTLQAAFAEDPNYLNAFLMEARAQGNLVHPHVLSVYYLGRSQDGLMYMAMQLVEGGSLQGILDRGERLTWQLAARHMLDLAEGLVEVARLGIVHRDIKPANVLIDRYGSTHLGDFGLAVGGGELPMPAGTPGPRQTYSVAGTPEYMAPEQARGEPVDQRADIYALGATFYQLLTGKTPVASVSDLTSLVRAHLGPPPPKTRELRPDVPRELAAIIDRCLARGKADRFQTHAELVAALRKALPQPEIPARPTLRSLAWALEMAPVAALLRISFGMMPWLPFTAYLLATAASLRLLGATPGQWLLRLRLRTVADGEVSPPRGLARFALQNLWLLPGSYFVHEAYLGSMSHAELSGVGAIALAALSFLGTLGAFFGKRQTLHDRLTGTRVLVDTR